MVRTCKKECWQLFERESLVWFGLVVLFSLVFHTSCTLPAFGKRNKNQTVSHLSDAKRLNTRWMHPIRHLQKSFLSCLKCQPLSSNFAYQHSDRGSCPSWIFWSCQALICWKPFWNTFPNLWKGTEPDCKYSRWGMAGECLFLWCLVSVD